MSDVSQIDGSAIRLKRESQGWAIADLASRACLSVKQIRQIEEGGMTAFYSESVKLTAARKVAGLLHMSEIQLFGQQVPAVEHHQDEDSLLHDSAHVSSPPLTAHVAAASVAANPITRSEALHVLAQPPEHVEEVAADVPQAASEATETATEAPELASLAMAETAAEGSSAMPESTVSQPETQPAGSGYFLKITALFLVALAAAALLRPKVLEDKPEAAASEAPPPAALTPTSGTPVSAEAVPMNSPAPAASNIPVAPVSSSPALAPSAAPAPATANSSQ